MTAIIKIIDDGVRIMTHSFPCCLQIQCSGDRSSGAGASAKAKGVGFLSKSVLAKNRLHLGG
jgi:hypothetical protein